MKLRTKWLAKGGERGTFEEMEEAKINEDFHDVEWKIVWW